MVEIEQPIVELDEKLKNEAVKFLGSLIDQVGLDYLVAGIRLAHRVKGVSKEDFWRTLTTTKQWNGRQQEVVTDNRTLFSPPDGPCPENLYEKLDFQACVKYLLYGPVKMLEQPEEQPPVPAEDCYAFFEYFAIDCTRPRNNRPGRINRDYRRNVLLPCRDLRNLRKHTTQEKREVLTRQMLDDDMEKLRKLTEHLERKANFSRDAIGEEERAALEELRRQKELIWDTAEAEYRRLFGSPPVDIQALIDDLCWSDETISERVWDAVNAHLEEYNLPRRGQKVYGVADRRRFKEKLREVLEKQELLKPTSRPEHLAGVKATHSPAPHLPSNEAYRALKAREPWPYFETDALGDFFAAGFAVTADESVFLCEEGLRLLKVDLRERLIKHKKKLLLDKSVITALFRALRDSAPDSPEELEALEELDPEERDLLLQDRKRRHQEARDAIKTLRYLREQGCLQVASSPVDDAPSYENIRAGVSYLQCPMLVLSQDALLADELAKAGNAVVLKVNALNNFPLLPRPQSKEVLRSILDAHLPQGAVPMPERASARPLSSAPMEGGTLQGFVMIAGDPQGSRREIRLGKRLGQGGEGEVYQVDGQTVAKVYFRDRQTDERREKLDYMLRNDPHISTLCWPTELLYTQEDVWVGFLMPHAKGVPLTVIYYPGRDYKRLVDLKWTRKSLVKIAENIAGSFAEMHAKGILMGDVNQRNFIVDPKTYKVRLVDCDSYQVGNYRCPVGTPLFTPPEVHKKMREEGREDYGFLRTEGHERYALAVLLFEILMLGKAPYDARGTASSYVIDAIIAGRFPYDPSKQRQAKEGENKRPADTGMVPVGRHKQIWSHTIGAIKDSFYDTFTGTDKGRLSATEWKKVMGEYYGRIADGHSTDELAPNTYKEVEGKAMIPLKCEACGLDFNIDEDSHKKLLKSGEPILCPEDRTQREIFRQRLITISCDRCHQDYEESCLTWLERSEKGQPLYCPKCFELLYEWVQCTQCGRKFLRRKGRSNRVLCKKCQG